MKRILIILCTATILMATAIVLRRIVGYRWTAAHGSRPVR